jgi:phosphatidylglycerol:prolipoprotein diacylglycerol transferase
MNPVLVTIGSFELRWYSIFILIAAIIMFMMVELEAKRFEIPQQFTFNMLFWSLLFGFVGARLYYVLFNFSLFRTDLMEILRVWNGGLAIHGGIIFGLLTLVLYCKKYKVRPVRMSDMIVVPLIIGQAIGRWGNFFNSEAYGSVVEYDTLIKMRIIPQFVIDNMEINGSYHLPMFYFESLACIIGFIILLIIRRRPYVKKGQIVGIYLVWYGFIRLIIEAFRTDSLMLYNIKIAQLVSVVMIIFGFYLISVQARKPKLDELYNNFDDEIKY